MIFRACENSIIFFDKKDGRTGIINGQDYLNILSWAKFGKENNSSLLLKSQKIISNLNKTAILSAIKSAQAAIAKSLAVPESLHIELTTNCNLNCRQCYQNREVKLDLDFNLLREYITEAGNIGVFQIAFGGGEPLLYPNLVVAVKMVSAYEMGCSITTNGKLLKQNLLNKLIDAGLDHIQVSLNGITNEINSLTRNGFEGAINALKLLSKNK